MTSTDYARIFNNDLDGNRTGAISPAGTHNVIKDNLGYVTENGGAEATVADGGAITHGLVATPTYVQAIGSVAGEFVSVTALDTDHFHVAIKKHDGSAGTTQTVYWRAWV